MERFSLCTATSEQDYFCFPASKPQESRFVSEFDPVLKKRDLVWRSPVAADLSFSLVSRSGEVTFSAGPLKSGREDKIGRPICNFVTVRSSNLDDKRNMGQIFAAMLASGEARDKFAEQLETQIVQPYLKGIVWDGRLPEFVGSPVVESGLPDASQQVYPKDGSNAGKCAGYIAALVESGRDFAVGLSVYSGAAVAKKLQEVYHFDWQKTFISVFSKEALFPAPLQAPIECPSVPFPPKPSPPRWKKLINLIFALCIVVCVIFAWKSCTGGQSDSGSQRNSDNNDNGPVQTQGVKPAK